jgi:DNA phosphorothioation-dependent restriction protein DptG
MSMNIEDLLKNYVVKKANNKIEFKHNRATRFPIVPFITKLNGKEIEKLDFGSFDGYIGHCYRQMQNFTLPEHMEREDYKHKLKRHVLEQAATLVNIDTGLDDKFANIIESLFFNGPDLIKYSVEAQAYLYWKKKDSGLVNIADFICKTFIDDQIAALWLKKSGYPENSLQQLLNKALPPLVDQTSTAAKADEPNDTSYHLFNPHIVELFKEDFKFLNENKQSFLNESDLLFKYYYFLYIIQLANTLNHFFEPGAEFRLFFTLDSETVSDNRQTIKTGWKWLEPRLLNMMSHSVNLDIVSRFIAPSGGADYQQMRKLFAGYDEKKAAELAGQLDELLKFYTDVVPVEKTTWDTFEPEFQRKVTSGRYQNELEHKVLELFYRIEFQFDNSTRKAKRLSFANWFLAFCKKNFLKSRGRNGYSLNLTQEMLLFMTKLCIGKEKIRFNDLMSAFNRRGIYFDEDTNKAIAEIFEKINLIEKKSDSGDAQYIRRIL